MIVRNRTAKRDYELLDTYEAGIVLEGREVKALRTQGGKLDGSYVKILDDELWLINAHIPLYSYAPRDDLYDPNRKRKLLIHKKERIQIKSKMEQRGNVTLIPLAIFPKNRKLKLEFAIGKGLKNWQQKRVEQAKSEKKRDQKEMKEYRMK